MIEREELPGPLARLMYNERLCRLLRMSVGVGDASALTVSSSESGLFVKPLLNPLRDR